MFKYGCHFTHDEELVKDCIHDVFVDLVRYRSTLGFTDNIRLYLFKSLKHKIISSVSKRNLQGALDTDTIPFQYSLSAEEEVVANENARLRIAQLEIAMAGLPPRQREAIYLKFVSNLSYEEISTLMKLNYQSARNLVFRGLEKLRNSLPRKVILIFMTKRATSTS